MALHWDVSRIDLKVRTIEVDGEQEMSRVTESLIWATMAVGMNSITEENAEDFYARLHLYELLRGPFLHKSGEPAPMTPEQVRAHIGLHTNASIVSLVKWRNQLTSDVLKQATRLYTDTIADADLAASAA